MTMFKMGTYDGAVLTHLDTDEPAEGSAVMLTLGSKVGVTLLFMEIEMLPEELLVGLSPDVALVVAFGNPLISLALIVK